ncbi:MAG: hypothetical protein JWR80_5476 [Bradyrhizobium sp.]|nr:hypothetical protein [Bradyrhizobium sp.]
MASSLPLKTMSVEEKLQAMDSLWDDLCTNAETRPSPSKADTDAGFFIDTSPEISSWEAPSGTTNRVLDTLP